MKESVSLQRYRGNTKWQSFTMAAWLGWQVESNWADPLLFAIYSVARPLAAVLILVVMYSVISNGVLDTPLFAYIYLGNALYMLVGAVITGVSWAVIDDRERYGTLKHLFATPMDGYWYLMGRGVTKLIIATTSVLITLSFGVLVFHLPLDWTTIRWGLFLSSTVLGVVCMACMGLCLGALTLQTARHFWSLGEAVAGSLYLFTGSIFPLDVLPPFLIPLGYVFPVTYWLEAARRALLGPYFAGFPTLAWLSDEALVFILAGFALGLALISRWYFRWSLHRAKEKGLIDMQTAY